MNFKQATKFFGFSGEEIEWDSESSRYQEGIHEVSSFPFQTDEIQKLLKELSEQEKRLLSNRLNFSIMQRTKKQFPDLLFQKEMNQFLQECKKENYHFKIRLFIALLPVLLPLLEPEDEYTLERFVAQQSALMEKFGMWHYYWAFVFHPGKTMNPVLWEQLCQELPDRLKSREAARSGDETNLSFSEKSDRQALRMEEELNGKITKLEQTIKSERILRQELEEKLAKEKKESNAVRGKLEQAVSKIEALEEALQTEKITSADNLSQLEQQQKQWRTEQSSWHMERTALRQQIKLSEQQLADVEKTVTKKDDEIRSLNKTVNELRTDIKAKHHLPAVVQEFTFQLYEELEKVTKKLKSRHFQQQLSGVNLRRHAKDILTLVEAVEEYVSKYCPDSPEERTTSGNIPVETDVVQTETSGAKEMGTDRQLETGSSATKADQEPEKAEEWYNGTFYRLDHGGYITLENEVDSFRIPESLVYEHDLQHEAEVRCKPLKYENDTTYYKIELLFQGDDSCSDIHQYNGYIQLGEHHTFYCVELNNPGSKFKVHNRDAMIHHLQDGLPCIFNVAEGSRIARISRIYKTYDLEKQPSLFAETAAGQKSSRSQKNKKRAKPEKYLTGVQIAVIGGQRKWFENVVTETGADFVHDDGYTPERLHADLRRSDALFLYLKANSHRATWGCIDIAKENKIPHFIIEGSKSNLRQLLWENRGIIKGESS
ncbi:hypothetical protein SAMN05421736_110138 [Evansella caseinilytica]|uniref:DUF2325 domain-containing protein n=1 Tax=Evansella caseinilytica TaxID=1503961 RepID=A0A1H3SD81_9BACI|nr:DUF2325 domain-containing protein [Evansella caseinilytica]SDZ35687.1 hypothetical protein SAMN05421736_110138 [Evansella caseinilytica]